MTAPTTLRATARTTPTMGIDAAYVLAGGLIATAFAWPIYQHPQALIVGIAGTTIGVAIAVVGRLLRLPWWADALATLAVYVAVAVPLAIPGLFPERWLEGLRDAMVGIVGGWKQLVTLDLPLGEYQAVLVPLLVLTLFGAYAATRIAVTARRAVILTPLILVAMAGVGIAFGTSEIVSTAPFRWLPALPIIGHPALHEVLIALGVLLIVLTVGWFAARSRQERRAALARAAGVARARVTVHRGSAGALLRRGGLAAGMLVAALAVGGAIAIPALQLDREVIRDSTRPFELVSPASSPLGGYRQWFQDERFDAELFTVTAPAEVERLRLAVLDEYDGTQFVVGDPEGASRFTRLISPAQGDAAAVRIVIGEGYREPWVPIPGDLHSTAEFSGERDRAILLEDTAYYAVDGSNAVVLAPGVDGALGLSAGDIVEISGATPGDARAAIAGATGGDALHGVTEERFPELIGWLESQAPRLNGQGLLDVIDALRARGYLSHALVGADGARWVDDVTSRVAGFEFKESRSGHSIARIEALFAQLTERQRQVVGAAGSIGPGTDEAELVAGVGDDEQFAAAGALIAWALGFEARVVVGVHLVETDAMLPPGGGAPAVEACEAVGGDSRCDGRNVGAWIELRVGDEWVPLDTSPQLTALPQENREGEQPPPHGTQPDLPSSSIIDPPVAAPAEGDAGTAPEDPAALGPDAIAPIIRVIGLILAASGLLALPAMLLLGAKAIRRARRRTEDPETSIVGAWDELVDQALDHRALTRIDGTRRQLAARIGNPAATQLAELADHAVFSPTSPTETQRDAAWELLAVGRERLSDGVPFFQRVRAALDPTSFIRHIPSRTVARPRSTGTRGVRLAGEVR